MLATAIVAPAGHAVEFPQHPVSGSFTVTSFNLVFFTDPGCEFGILLDWSITGDIAPFGPSTITMHTCQHLTGNDEIDTSFTLRGRGFARGNDPSLPRHAASTAGRRATPLRARNRERDQSLHGHDRLRSARCRPVPLTERNPAGNRIGHGQRPGGTHRQERLQEQRLASRRRRQRSSIQQPGPLHRVCASQVTGDVQAAGASPPPQEALLLGVEVSTEPGQLPTSNGRPRSCSCANNTATLAETRHERHREACWRYGATPHTTQQ